MFQVENVNSRGGQGRQSPAGRRAKGRTARVRRVGEGAKWKSSRKSTWRDQARSGGSAHLSTSPPHGLGVPKLSPKAS